MNTAVVTLGLKSAPSFCQLYEYGANPSAAVPVKVIAAPVATEPLPVIATVKALGFYKTAYLIAALNERIRFPRR